MTVRDVDRLVVGIVRLLLRLLRRRRRAISLVFSSSSPSSSLLLLLSTSFFFRFFFFILFYFPLWFFFSPFFFFGTGGGERKGKGWGIVVSISSIKAARACRITRTVVTLDPNLSRGGEGKKMKKGKKVN